MENFIEALENDHILSRGAFSIHGNKIQEGRPLSSNYKRSIKMTIRKFYKWLWGDCRSFPKIVEWIDTHDEPLEVPAITEAEVQQMVDECRSPVQRALVQVFFDSGVRPGELINIRLRHVQILPIDPDNPSIKCYVIRVPFSKTLPRSIPLPMLATTRLLQTWLRNHPGEPVTQGDGTMTAIDLEQQLFPLTENGISQILERAAKRALDKHATPTIMRHSSATYWANKLSHFQMCKRFGWSMTSKMPARYIDRAGIRDMEAARIYLKGNQENHAFGPGLHAGFTTVSRQHE